MPDLAFPCLPSCLRKGSQCCIPSCTLRSEFLKGADLPGTPFALFPPQQTPGPTSFVENYASRFVPCCPFHLPILSAGHTDGVVDGSTGDSRRAASKSTRRKRQT